jgi:hypothetical protein
MLYRRVLRLLRLHGNSVRLALLFAVLLVAAGLGVLAFQIHRLGTVVVDEKYVTVICIEAHKKVPCPRSVLRLRLEDPSGPA